MLAFRDSPAVGPLLFKPVRLCKILLPPNPFVLSQDMPVIGVTALVMAVVEFGKEFGFVRQFRPLNFLTKVSCKSLENRAVLPNFDSIYGTFR